MNEGNFQHEELPLHTTASNILRSPNPFFARVVYNPRRLPKNAQDRRSYIHFMLNDLCKLVCAGTVDAPLLLSTDDLQGTG